MCPADRNAELVIGCLGLLDQRLERDMYKLPDRIANYEVHGLKERVEHARFPQRIVEVRRVMTTM